MPVLPDVGFDEHLTGLAGDEGPVLFGPLDEGEGDPVLDRQPPGSCPRA